MPAMNIEPDVRISRIRLSDWLHLEAHDGRLPCYQLLAALGLSATFVTVLAQLILTTQQWHTDYQLRLGQDQAKIFGDAATDLGQSLLPSSQGLAGPAAYRLFDLVQRNPVEYYFPVSKALMSVIRGATPGNDLTASWECHKDVQKPGEPKPALEAESGQEAPAEADRQEAPAAAQEAMTILGHPTFARFRKVFSRGQCVSRGHLGVESDVLGLDHLKLNNFDLGNRDLSCSSMTQAKLRRINLSGSTLAGADLSGASLDDWEIPDSPARTGWLKGWHYSTERAFNNDEVEEWRRYRCYITDLRGADLRGAKFNNAGLARVDFSGADLTGAVLSGANISRAKFTAVRGLAAKALEHTCVGLEGASPERIKESQPLGLKENVVIPACKHK
jgi:uncharacterized protein YjbI with pentapeptide repeats